MKRSAFLWATILSIACFPDFSAASDTEELDEHLSFFKQLIGLQWEGGYVGENAPEIVISLRFESILAGKAVKYTREAPAADYFSETHFYWNPDKEKVLFINLNSRGILGEGVVSFQDGEIILLGDNYWEDGSIEFKTIMRLGQDGVLKDTFKRKKAGEWVEGHYQEFVIKE